MTNLAHLFVSALTILFLGTASAETGPLQDFCVADLAAGVKVNGYACKNVANVTPDDFFFSGLANHAPVPVNNTMGFVVTLANVDKFPGVNTLGISMSRIDYAPGGLNPPHIHPRASEVVFILEGQVEVGFITTTNTLISKVLNKGDMFVFPRALLHYQRNVQNAPASVLAAFNSQLPGTQPFVSTIFGAKPSIPDDILAKTFQIGAKKVQQIRTSLAAPKK